MNFKLGKMIAVGMSSLALSSITTAQIDEIIVTCLLYTSDAADE